MPTPDEITTWAQGIGLARCVGQEFVDEHGYLPRTLDELVTWGNSTGRRNPGTGGWQCLGGSAPPPPTGGGNPPPAGGGPPMVGGNPPSVGTPSAFDLNDWIQKNPLLAVGGALLIGMLLFGRRR